MHSPEKKGYQDIQSKTSPSTVTWVLEGPTKNVEMIAEITNNRLSSSSYIYLAKAQEPKVPNETRALAVRGILLSLKKANENNLDWQMDFTAEDPLGKMQKWIDQNVGEGKNFQKTVTTDKLEEEIAKMESILKKLNFEQNIEESEWESMTLQQAQTLQPGQSLVFCNKTREGRNNIANYGETVSFVKYSKPTLPNSWPLITVSTMQGLKSIQSRNLKLAS